MRDATVSQRFLSQQRRKQLQASMRGMATASADSPHRFAEIAMGIGIMYGASPPSTTDMPGSPYRMPKPSPSPTRKKLSEADMSA